jgi:hypothetical protein
MKNQNLIETSPSPRIIIEQIGGDLALTGWERAEFRAIRGEDIEIRVEDEVIFVRCDDDCTLQAPMGATLEVHGVGGDAIITKIHGGAQINHVGGDLRLNEMGALTIDQVGGDLTVHQVQGDLRAQTVGGDGKVANVQGACQVLTGGDIHLSGVNGNIQVEAGGDVNLRLNPTGEQSYQVEAGGDILCRLPENPNVKVQATCGGEIVVKRLPAPVRRAEQELTFTIGTGEATLALSAGGDISLFGQGATGEWDAARAGEFGAEFGADFGERAAQIAQQVAGQVERQMEHLARQMDEKFAHFGSEEMAGRVQERVQNAMRKAEERIAEVMRHTEHRVQEAERRASERQARHGAAWQMVQPPQRPQPPRAPKAPQVTPPQPRSPKPIDDEERRMILRMVSEGKVSVEQADRLLAALKN